MLHLKRRQGEVIVIGQGIRVVVEQIDRGAVSIGVEAPPDVVIWREEVLKRRTAEQERQHAR